MTRPYNGNAPSALGSAIALIVLVLGIALASWVVLAWPASNLASIVGFAASLGIVACSLLVLEWFERRAFRAWMRSPGRHEHVWQTVPDPRVRPGHAAVTRGRGRERDQP